MSKDLSKISKSKKIIISILGGRQFIIFKSLSVIKNPIMNYIKLFPFLKNNYFSFYFKMISSEYFVQFNYVKPKKKEYLNKKYSFKYRDWFSDNINVWKKFLSNVNNIKYLEIGTFEGRSALFISEFENSRKIVCVDPYIDYNEIERYDFKMENVYESVKEKISKIKNKDINLIKKTSDEFFLENKESFNVIYIDGSHHHEDVKKDFINSMNCLEKNGILICDDFLWFRYKKIEENPISATIECYYKYQKNLKILFINHQIIFKKIN